ncbi:hypothetical protein [Apilactobacillus timberlakei]|uniref:hypothetical protein n=1 Tax=Apilactobacillus timberlakei TaxID=2008380 RepID=UPI0011286874|nr:hypothetical protein [Apilactobacillus timberlakei]TPR16649.1 hypothetical protein DYZ95_07345 [Apilactobacillus timberlakei]
MALEIDKNAIIEKIKLIHPEIYNAVSGDADSVLSTFIDSAKLSVQAYNPPIELSHEMVMLVTCSKINNYNADDSTGVKVGPIDLDYKSNANGSDDPYMDEFNTLVSQYGLTTNNARITGF